MRVRMEYAPPTALAALLVGYRVGQTPLSNAIIGLRYAERFRSVTWLRQVLGG